MYNLVNEEQRAEIVCHHNRPNSAQSPVEIQGLLDMGKTNWVSIIIEAFLNLSGSVELEELYFEVDRMLQARNLKEPKSSHDIIRARIYERSSDSEVFKGKQDLFQRLSSGRWKLRDNQSIQEAKGYSEAENQLSFKERKKRKMHFCYEGRLSKISIDRNKKYRGCICEACGMDFGKVYPSIGEGYIQAHHVGQYSDMQEDDGRVLRPSDFLMLCSNCHDMIHRLNNQSNIEKLKQVIEDGKKAKR